MATAYSAPGAPAPADADVPDDSGVDRLIDSFRQPAYNLAFRLVRRPEDAADAVQDAFVLAMRATRGNSAAPREAGSFRAWLLKIVANVALAQLRRRRAGTSVSLDALGADLPDRHADQPLTAVMRREQRGDVLQVLLALPDVQRAALTLREYQGLSYDEIGEMLGLERGAITALLYRARAGFRAAYTGVATRSKPLGCSNLAPLMSAMLDAELEPATWKRVDRHVHGCLRCRRELKQLRRGQHLRSIIPLLAPPVSWSTASSLGAAGAAGAPAVAGLVGKAADLTRPLVTSSLLGAAAAGPAGGLGPAVERGVGKLAALAAAAGLLLTLAAGGPSRPQTAESAPLSAPAEDAQSASIAQSVSAAQAVLVAPAASFPSGGTGERWAQDASGHSGAIAARASDALPSSAPPVAEREAISPIAEAAVAQRAPSAPIEHVATHDPGGVLPASEIPGDGPPTAIETGSASAPPETGAHTTGPNAGGAGTATAPPPTVEIEVAGLPPIELSVDLPPLDLAGLEVPPIDLPPVDVPPVDLPAVDLPPVDLPPVDLSTIAVGDINLPRVDVPTVNLPPIDLPPVDLPAVDLPAVDLAEVPLVDCDSVPECVGEEHAPG